MRELPLEYQQVLLPAYWCSGQGVVGGKESSRHSRVTGKSTVGCRTFKLRHKCWLRSYSQLFIMVLFSIKANYSNTCNQDVCWFFRIIWTSLHKNQYSRILFYKYVAVLLVYGLVTT